MYNSLIKVALFLRNTSPHQIEGVLLHLHAVDRNQKLAVGKEIVNPYTFNLPHPAVRPGCVPRSSIIVCNEKLE